MDNTNAGVFMLAATLAIASTVSAQEAGNAPAVSREIDPFTHIARIPAGADLASIKFQGVKVVTVPTKTVVTSDAHYCDQATRRDSAGSMFCPAIQPEAFARAYQVTYSYEGPSLASDETGNRKFTFTVYFRPEELSPAERDLLLHGKDARADAAGTFALTTWRALDERLVVDAAHSTMCKGSYRDGLWMASNPSCEDNLKFQTILAPSDYVTVRVDHAAIRAVASTGLAQ